MREKQKFNYVVPLGSFRGEFDEAAVDPAWKLIHELRLKNGVSTTELQEVTGCSNTTISKGERGGHVSVRTTRRILQVFGYDLKIVPKEESPDA